MAAFVLCRRDVSDFGQAPKFCAKPIKTPNSSDRCDDCLARLPMWPTDDLLPGIVASSAQQPDLFTNAQETI